MKDEQGKASKPWLRVVLDDASRAIAGYRLSWSLPGAVQTALTLRQASLVEGGGELAGVWDTRDAVERSWQ